MSPDTAPLLTDLLKQVSRSFYTTLRILPASIRNQIGLAYLLARAADTIADTGLVSVETRLARLQFLRERISGLHQKPIEFGPLAEHQGSPAEGVLLRRVEEALALLSAFGDSDRAEIRRVLDTITSGQELDLKRFGHATIKNIAIPLTDPELEDYTYRVAGCVGEFWTKLCRTHVFPGATLDDAMLYANGIRFGKGLQLVNILRDLPKDLRQGRCYLPKDRLEAGGLKPQDLLDPAAVGRFRAVYDRYLDQAYGHLSAGWDYTGSVPRSCVRVRLACAWPLLIGVRTLTLLRTRNVLDANQRIKISRLEVRKILVRSIMLYPFPGQWRRLFSAAARP